MHGAVLGGLARQGQLDPTKEAKAAIMQADRGFKTYEQVTRELGGGDWEDNIEQLGKGESKVEGCWMVVTTWPP